MAAPQMPLWSDLSASVRSAFGWAAASTVESGGKPPGEPAVVAGALLIGVIRSHEGSSEPVALLDHFGRTREGLFEVLRKVVGGGESLETRFRLDPNPPGPRSLDDFPWLSPSVEEILQESSRLAKEADPAPDGLLHLPTLFGGILRVEGTDAYRALTEVLGDNVPMREIRESYLDFLKLGRNRPSYRNFLNGRFPVASLIQDEEASVAPIVRVGNLGGAGNDRVAAEDQLDFKRYVDAFARLIDSPHTNPPLTIGIYGSWGMGKSFLLEHINRKLRDTEFKNRPLAPDETFRPDVYIVHFNAWEYNATEVVWPGLVRKIMDTFEEEVPWPFPGRFLRKLWRNFRGEVRRLRGRLILLAIVLAVLLFVAFWSSDFDAAVVGSLIGLIGFGGLLKLVADTWVHPLSGWVTTLFEENEYGRYVGYMEQIKIDLDGLEKRLHVEDEDGGDRIVGRILVLVDDLDRCEPEKAVEVLQAINLLLDFPTFIVCLGIDARIITGAIERHYGGLLGEVGASGYEYLDKIIQIPFRIPQPSEKEIKTFIAKQLGDPEPPPEEREPAPAEDTGSRVPGDASTEGARENGAPADEALGNAPPAPATGTVKRPGADTRVAFTYYELRAFQDIAGFLRPNPRQLKRLVNVYRLVRTLADARDERAILDKPAATIRWLVMCDQWPYTSHAMLWHFGEMLDDWDDRIPAHVSSRDPLLYLLDEIDPLISKQKQRRLDGDPESLRELLELEEGRLTWAELRRIRQYTVNFNPAIENALRVPASEGRLSEPVSDGLPEMAP